MEVSLRPGLRRRIRRTPAGLRGVSRDLETVAVKLAKMYCRHPSGAVTVLLSYLKCQECGRQISAARRETRCFCGSTRIGPVMEDCVCTRCNTRWTRLQEAGGETD